LAHGALNTVLKIAWRVKIESACSKAFAKDLMTFVSLGAGRASAKMILDLRASYRIQLTIKVAVD
jgi:dihydroxyacetone kinase DhaKLM complex PTS-EIIA-like component DhaM